jgi:hypothetical protein
MSLLSQPSINGTQFFDFQMKSEKLSKEGVLGSYLGVEKEVTVNKDKLIQKITRNDLKSQNTTSLCDLTKRQFQVAEKKNKKSSKEIIAQNRILFKSEQSIQKEDLHRKQRDFKEENRHSSENESQQRQNSEQSILAVGQTQELESQNTALNTLKTVSFVVVTSELYIPDAHPTKEGESNSYESVEISTIQKPSFKETKINDLIKATKIDLSEKSENELGIGSIAKAGLAIIAGLGTLYAISNVMKTSPNPVQLDKEGGNFSLPSEEIHIQRQLDKANSCESQLQNFELEDNIPQEVYPESNLRDISSKFNLARDKKIEDLLQKAEQSDNGNDWWQVANACENQDLLEQALNYYTKGAEKGDFYCMNEIESLKDKILIPEPRLSNTRFKFYLVHGKKIKDLLQKAEQSDNAIDWRQVANECKNQNLLKQALNYYTKGAEKGDLDCMNGIESLKGKILILKSDLSKIRFKFNQVRDKKIQDLFQKAQERDRPIHWLKVAEECKNQNLLEQALSYYIKGAEKGDLMCMNEIEFLKGEISIQESNLSNISSKFKQARDKKINDLLQEAEQSDSAFDWWQVAYACKNQNLLEQALSYYSKGAEKGDLHCMNQIESLKGKISIPKSDLSNISSKFKQARDKKINDLLQEAEQNDKAIDWWQVASACKNQNLLELALSYYTKGAEKGDLHCMNEIESLKNKISIPESNLSNISSKFKQARDKKINDLLQEAEQSDKAIDWWRVANECKNQNLLEQALSYYIKGAEKGDLHCINEIESLKK